MTISDDSERLARLEQQMERISGRLAALEHVSAPPAVPPAEWAEPGDTTLSYSGQGQFGADRLMIRQRARMSHVLDADPDQVAKVFAALGSPARIILLRALLNGPRTSQQLRAELDDASVGQLYHHLRELMAVGLISQPGRSLYAISRGSQVALCIQIVAAAQLSSGTPRFAPPEEDQPGPPGDEQA